MSDFDAIANEMLSEPGVEEGTGFGSQPGLRIGGKIFAMHIDGRLVVKLPAERCDELGAARGAATWGVGTRRMREWGAREPGAHQQRRLHHADEAFVG